ncbi:MAG: divergent polysaccharide deacetylase family protein [Desulfosalsimonadaceae bacterium]
MGRFFKNVTITALFVLISVGAGAGYYFIKNWDALRDKAGTRLVKSPGIEKPSGIKAAIPDFEVFPDVPVTKPEPSEPRVPPPPDKRPQIVIIIDDLGYDRALAEKFLSIEGPLTYAILPHSPHSIEIANAAKRKGAEVMLHLPMEPDEYPETDPGPGALLSVMTPDERIAALENNLDAVPFISGVNNHMGSKMSANSEHMNQVLSIMKKRGLYYIDSLTTHNSKSRSSARLFQVPFAQRDVFLDHAPEPAAIRIRLDQLVRIAELHGQAIGIGHPYETTYEVLSEMLPVLREKVQMIPASEAVRLAGY